MAYGHGYTKIHYNQNATDKGVRFHKAVIMSIESAYDEFIKKCELLIHAIEVSLPSKQNWEKENSELALKNAKKWLQLAIDRDLYHEHRRNFGLSKSDLMFGEFEDRLYELEHFYSKNIYDAHGK